MSARHRGRGRGGRNPLAPLFQQLPLHQTPTSPDDTRMDEGQSSAVHTVPAPPSPTTSARESEPFQYPEPRQISADLSDTNLGVRLRLSALEELLLLLLYLITLIEPVAMMMQLTYMIRL